MQIPEASGASDGALQETEAERRVKEACERGERISRNVNLLHDERLTLGQRAADRLADVAGSWTFIIWFAVFIVVWIAVNAIGLIAGSGDPYPFILLNLLLSMLAAIQAPVIMMSQNRMEAKDTIRAEHDYEINLKAELEIAETHAKLDKLREIKWKELVEMQQIQIALLERQLAILSGGKPSQA